MTGGRPNGRIESGKFGQTIDKILSRVEKVTMKPRT